MATTPSTPAATPTLVCKECSYENEPERVYCHQCGAKLDRSLLPPEALAPKEDPEEVRRRLRRMANPPGAGAKIVAGRLVSSLVLGAIFGAVVLACLPPRDDARLPQDQVDNAPLISAQLEDALATPPGPARRLVFPEAAVNAYLAANVRSRRINNGASAYAPSFERIYVRLREGNVCRVTQQQSFFGLPLYVSCDYRPLTRPDGHVAAEPGAGAVGRMPVLPALARYLAPLAYGSVFEKQKSDLNLLGRFGSVVCRKEQVEFVTRPGG